MKPWSRFLLAVILLGVPGLMATAAVRDYRFTAYNTGSYTKLSGATMLINGTDGTTGVGAYNDQATAGPIGIGFTFYFDGSAYTSFTVNPHGLLILGTSTSTSYANSLNSPPMSDAIISPFWDHQHLYNGSSTCSPLGAADVGVMYQLSGTAPNRVLTVEWRTQLVSNNTYYYTTANNCMAMLNYEVRLYECSNAIEFHYGWFRVSTNTAVNSTASIGLAHGSSNFISVTPAGTSATASTTTADDNVNNNNAYATDSIRYGMIYRFDPNNLTMTGRIGTGNGGTAAMNNLDSLFTGFTVTLGNFDIYRPMSISGLSPSGCAPLTWSLSITGSSDYFFGTPGVQTISGTASSSNPAVPAISFAPSATGLRPALLTLTDGSSGATKSFILAASGTTRIRFVGNTAEGGTSTVANGDTLLSSMSTLRGTFAQWRPVGVENFNAAPTFSSSPVTVTATVDSGSFPTTQYRIIDPVTGNPVTSVTTTIGPGATYAPIIRFTGLGAGPQWGRLRITTSDGDSRTYNLLAISAAPAANITSGVNPLMGQQLFGQQLSCVGTGSFSIPILVENTGYGDLLIKGLEVYQIDTLYHQGTPPRLMLRDEFGNLVPAPDYFLTLQPGTAPVEANALATYPVVIPQGQSRTVYLTFVGSMPGRRFARGFLRTNALNFVGPDTNGANVEGVVQFEVFAGAIGAGLAGGPTIVRPRPVIFREAPVGDTTVIAYPIYNSGSCDLRINRDRLQIFAGDVTEFAILSAFANSRFDNVSGDYVIAPLTADTLRLRFIPSRPGTRSAAIRLHTNDSTLGFAGLVERGTYYLDLYGRGLAGLDGRDIVLDPVVIGQSATGEAVLENSLDFPVELMSVAFQGGNASEFSENTAQPWPSMPYLVAPGQKVKLGIRMTPTGLPGLRRTTMLLTTSNAGVVTVNVRGEAGTQEVVVSPNSLFDNTTLSIGESYRQTVRISNNGTLPVRLSNVQITGPDAANYRLGIFPRMDVLPGATEQLEITFAPQTLGQSSATLVISANGIDHNVTLGGTARRVRGPEDPSTGTISMGDPNLTPPETGASGISEESRTVGALSIRPNPAREEAVVAFGLAKDGSVLVQLFDERGALVRTILDAPRLRGAQSVRVPLDGIASGRYQVRVTSHGSVQASGLVVTR